MEYRELEFTSPREEKDFGKWLTESPFNPMACAVPRENIAWEKVLNLFRSEEERKKEGWYCSFQDVYGELLAEFSGEAAPRPPLEDQMAEAMQVLHGSVRLGASKVMQLARRGYPPAMALASDFFAHDFVLHSGKVRNDLAFRYARDAVDAGYEGALAMLGFYYALGIGVKKDSQKAIELLQKGNDCRHPGNYRFMALVFGYGILTEKDPQAALDYVSAAMQEGDLFAFLAMRDLLNNGLLPQDEYEPPELTAYGYGNPFATYFWARRILAILFSPEYKPTGEERGTASAVFQWLHAAATHFDMPVAGWMLESLAKDAETRTFGDVSFSFAEIAPAAIAEAERNYASAQEEAARQDGEGDSPAPLQ